ncbi:MULTISPECIES: hypothetical protein [unclassified Saccharicrinis]|uniref:hypothetical protein n=1 Tax=unclassified Saccharicrinis TaxID=2646859 RepID=UPI003D32CACC
MKTNQLLTDAEKIAPSKKTVPILILFFAIGLCIIIGIIMYSQQPNTIFFKTSINGKVNDIQKEIKNVYFLIDSTWYLIKKECIDEISTGDSIAKEKNSYTLTIYNKGNIKWKGEVKKIKFRKVN